MLKWIITAEISDVALTDKWWRRFDFQNDIEEQLFLKLFIL